MSTVKVPNQTRLKSTPSWIIKSQSVWDSYLSVHKRLLEECAGEEVDGILDQLSDFEDDCTLLKIGFKKLLKRFDFSSTQREVPSIQNGADVIKQLVDQRAQFLRHFTSNVPFSNPAVNIAAVAANPDPAFCDVGDCKYGNCRKCNQFHNTRLHEAFHPRASAVTLDDTAEGCE